MRYLIADASTEWSVVTPGILFSPRHKTHQMRVQYGDTPPYLGIAVLDEISYKQCV